MRQRQKYEDVEERQRIVHEGRAARVCECVHEGKRGRKDGSEGKRGVLVVVVLVLRMKGRGEK